MRTLDLFNKIFGRHSNAPLLAQPEGSPEVSTSPELNWNDELDPRHLLAYLDDLQEFSFKSRDSNKEFSCHIKKLNDPSYLKKAIPLLPENKQFYAFLAVYGITREYYKRRKKPLIGNSDSLLNYYIKSILCVQHIRGLIGIINNMLNMNLQQTIEEVKKHNDIPLSENDKRIHAMLLEANENLINQIFNLHERNATHKLNPFYMFKETWRNEHADPAYIGIFTNNKDKKSNGPAPKRLKTS